MRLVVGSVLIWAFVGHAAAGSMSVVADRDGTLFEDPEGALASGAGPSVFAGRNNFTDNGVRRGLFHFDLAGVLPPGGAHVVQSVAVVITNVSESNTTPREYRLHRVLADWGEGASMSAGGGGAPAEPSARLVVAGPGAYRFEGPELIRDLALWAANPEHNFGWILIGDETVRQTAKGFASREHPDPALRPVLEIRFRGAAER